MTYPISILYSNELIMLIQYILLHMTLYKMTQGKNQTIAQ